MARPGRDLRARTVSEFVRLFERGGELYTAALQWYRGEARLRRRGSLLPSIARPLSQLEKEWEIYQRFRQNAAAFLPHTSLSEWDWLLYMRHYGQHTRLLDWTESALVGLYFAVENPSEDRYDGVVWCLDPLRLNDLAGYGQRIQCAGIDTDLDNYTSQAVKRATEADLFKPVALIAPRSFPRLIAQQGVFTVIHRSRVALDEIGDAGLLRRVRVAAAAKLAIRTVLRSLGMTRVSLFPELQSLAERR